MPRGARGFAAGGRRRYDIQNGSRHPNSAVQNKFSRLRLLVEVFINGRNFCRLPKCKVAKEDEMSGRCPSK